MYSCSHLREEDAVMKCPKCLSENTDTARYCSSCATSLRAVEDIEPFQTKTFNSPAEIRQGTVFGGHYEIIEKLGQGGMGEVYRAHDKNLGRQVAIKVLPEEFSEDRERMARFEREAKLLAALNHPNIALIYSLQKSDGRRFLVLELIEGETLSTRLASGPLPVEEALETCMKIAEGLEAAHEKGIIHRDLKPANVMISPEGKVKVLDFGLAKVYAAETTGIDIEKSPTITAQMTAPGVIMGTAAYMSPEQARSRSVDKKTDIWAFGCVLYEGLTGTRAFQGETVSDIMAHVLKGEPDWTKLPPNTPVAIKSLLRRCLQKHPKKRLHDIADARIEIEEALEGSSSSDLEQTTTLSSKWRTLFWSTVGLAALMLSVLLWNPWQKSNSSDQRPIRFVIPTPPFPPLASATYTPGNLVAVSPDGRIIAYVADSENDTKLYIHELNRFDAEVLPAPGLRDVHAPFFSPDNQWLGFFSEGKLKKMLLSGGQPSTIAEVPLPLGPIWGPDDTIIFGVPGEGLKQISSAGGELKSITTVDYGQGEWLHIASQFLPSGEDVLYSALNGSAVALYTVALNLKTGQQNVIIEGASQAFYAPPGFLVFSQNKLLMAAPFDISKFKPTGPSKEVLRGVMTGPHQGPLAGFSKNGTLIYVPGVEEAAERMLVWVDRQGNSEPVLEDKGRFFGPRISPDGRKLAMWMDGQVWIYDFERGTLRPLTSEGQNFWPVWTPDGQRVAFPSIRAGSTDVNLFWKRVDGSAPSERLTQGQYVKQPLSWSPDGKILLFHQSLHPSTGWDIWALKLDDDRTSSPLLNSQFNERRPSLSPDGRWLAYESDESGRPEVYVTTFPNPGSRWLISSQGGTEPAWSRSRQELFYRNADKMMVVGYVTDPEFVSARPRLLFEGKYSSTLYGRNYDITDDGQRFVMVKSLTQESSAAQINVVLNWFEELKGLFSSEK